MWRQQWQFGAVNKPAWLIPYPQTLSLKAIILIVLKRNFQVIHHIIDLPSHNWLTNQTISPHLLCNHLTISRARFDTSFDTLWLVLTHCFEHEVLTCTCMVESSQSFGKPAPNLWINQSKIHQSNILWMEQIPHQLDPIGRWHAFCCNPTIYLHYFIGSPIVTNW